MSHTNPMDYHKYPTPGKIGIRSTKRLNSKDDLSLAYTPGVAEVCMAIKNDPSQAEFLTNRGNMLAIITDGTAVLGLGNIGPLASKPVMEGKSVLFKKFADVDVIDLELATTDPEKIVEIILALEPSFGGIILEDITAPGCFYIEEELIKRMAIPVFHDDQHGSAIVIGAGIKNALQIVGKDISKVKCVMSGAGAAALATAELLVTLGMRRENIFICDRSGLITDSRKDLNKYKLQFASNYPTSDLEGVMHDADIFIGLSAEGIVTGEMVKTMAQNPIIFTLANPVPEIMPEEVLKVRGDAIISTGRSDFPNQVNNVLCFPYIFRGALDVGATKITQNMKIACVDAIAGIARQGFNDINGNYDGVRLEFGRDYFIPLAFDQRLLCEVSAAAAVAAMQDGDARRPIVDIEKYKESLMQRVSAA